METVKTTINDAITSTKQALTSAPPSDQYLRWDAPGVEVMQQDEETKGRQIAEVMNRMQQRNFSKHRKAFTATHVKSQGFVKGKLQVRADLPEHLRQGMFSEPGKTYDVAARYANEPFVIQPDQEAGPRGIALKVFGVEGERLPAPGNETATTQDWLMNNAPSLELTDVDTTLEIMSLREKYFDDPTGLGLQLKMRSDLIKQHAPYMLPNTNIISHAYYTQSAFRFGDYYGHIGLFPVKEEQKRRDEKVTKNDPEGVISDWLLDYFEGNDAVYEMRIQLGTDPNHHPTEDTSVVWDELTAPYQTLATVTFPKQNSFSHARRIFWEEKMYLSPFHGLAAHQPLGSVNRLRSKVYPASRMKRDEINVKESKTVHSIDDIPN